MTGHWLVRSGEHRIQLVVRSQLRVVRRGGLIGKQLRLLFRRQGIKRFLGLGAEREHVFDVFGITLLLVFMLGGVVSLNGAVAGIAVSGVPVIRLFQVELVQSGVNDLLILHLLQGIDLCKQVFCGLDRIRSIRSENHLRISLCSVQTFI